MQITERDRRMLAFAADHRFVLGAHIATLLGISTPAASARLRALRDAGYLKHSRPFQDEPRHYQATTAGLRAISSDLRRPPQVDLSLYRHDAGLAWLTVAAERGMFGPLRQVVPERQMRSLDGRSGDGEGRSASASGASARWAPAPVLSRSRGRDRHRPSGRVRAGADAEGAAPTGTDPRRLRRRPAGRRRHLSRRPPGAPAGHDGARCDAWGSLTGCASSRSRSATIPRRRRPRPGGQRAARHGAAATGGGR